MVGLRCSLWCCENLGSLSASRSLRSRSMTKPFLLAGLAALALVSIPAAAQQSPEAVAEAALTRAPVFDGHNDVPWALRGRVGNVINGFDFVDPTDTADPDRDPPRGAMPTDIQRLRKGHVVAPFWSVYVPSNNQQNEAARQSPEAVAEAALTGAPVFDGHNDVPWALRGRVGNVINGFDFVDTTDTAEPDRDPPRGAMHTDIQRLRKGHVGAQFWSVYVPSNDDEDEAVRQTIEQIDVAKRLIARYPKDMMLAANSAELEKAMKAGKIAGMLGMEGGQSIGSSLAVLRQMYDLGARYMTLTHGRNTPWADSATDAPEHDGLTDFGRQVVAEMNRIGMVVDLSHVSPATMKDALAAAKAPVMFSHSGARGVNDHPRNVPDDVLPLVKANGGVVMVVLYRSEEHTSKLQSLMRISYAVFGLK